MRSRSIKDNIVTVVAKRTVSGDVDIVILTEFQKFWLLKERMTFKLIGGLCDKHVSVKQSMLVKTSGLTGYTPVASMMPLRYSTVKLETPTART
jgi:hypothetical protein